jgi:hypothetical protein
MELPVAPLSKMDLAISLVGVIMIEFSNGLVCFQHSNFSLTI